jgi:DNA-binding response OmpR family regulator
VKVLIVDDDRATTGLLKTVFEMEGFRTIVCPDPQRVVDIVRQDRPDVVLMDFHLAETNSLFILREIRQDEACAQAGADGFILKPFRPANLMAEVRAVLKSNRSAKMSGTWQDSADLQLDTDELKLNTERS